VHEQKSTGGRECNGKREERKLNSRARGRGRAYRLLKVGASKMLANYLNECQTAGKNPSWSWDEKLLSSCDKRILKITQNPIADAENTARKTVPNTFFWGDSSRDRQPNACAIWGCLGAIILSQVSWGSVMRAKDETSVDIMCRKLSWYFLRERRI
jgi:hypothetical protein